MSQTLSKLFVRIQGLDRNIDQESYITLVKGIFKETTTLEDSAIQLILDRKFGGYRNFCFVHCAPENIAAWEEATNNTEFDGYSVMVNEAQPMEDRPQRDDRRPSRPTTRYNDR